MIHGILDTVVCMDTGKKNRGDLMERYELANGKVYEITMWSDTYTVTREGKVVYSGSYAGCRKYINSQK